MVLLEAFRWPNRSTWGCPFCDRSHERGAANVRLSADDLTIAQLATDSSLEATAWGFRKSMNDNAIAAIGGTSRVALGGLAQRLVQDGLLDEQAMQDAIARSKEKRLSLVTHLVGANLATARDIAISASHEFAVPLLALD